MPEVGRAARGEEDPQGGDEHERLGDLDGQGAGEGPPPQPGQALGLGQGVADQADRRGDDEQDDQGQADDVGGEHDDGEHGDDPAQQHDEDAAVGERAEDELAEHDGGLGGVDALAEDGLGERVGRRDGQAGQAEAGVDGDGGDHDAGQTSLRAVRVWSVSWPMTMAPPTKTKRTRKASAMPSVICHSSPTRLWAVTFGVASRVWPSRVRTGSSAEVTRSRNQPSMAASMWPVMSNRPGEVGCRRSRCRRCPVPGWWASWCPPGPTWMPGRTLPEPE